MSTTGQQAAAQLAVPPHVSISSDHDYASVDCGAQVVAANEEAQSKHHIITRSRDEYMLNPCNADMYGKCTASPLPRSVVNNSLYSCD